jgi:hypothetical protein
VFYCGASDFEFLGTVIVKIVVASLHLIVIGLDFILQKGSGSIIEVHKYKAPQT